MALGKPHPSLFLGAQCLPPGHPALLVVLTGIFSMLSLTQQERFFLCCLCAVLLIGTGLDYAFKRCRGFARAVCVLDRTEPDPIDLNTATAEELTRLPNVGQVLAGRIIVLREERGGILRTEDLLEVRGIGPVYLERMRPFLRRDGEER